MTNNKTVTLIWPRDGNVLQTEQSTIPTDISFTFSLFQCLVVSKRLRHQLRIEVPIGLAELHCVKVDGSVRMVPANTKNEIRTAQHSDLFKACLHFSCVANSTHKRAAVVLYYRYDDCDICATLKIFRNHPHP